MKMIADKRILALVILNAALYVMILISDFVKIAGGVTQAQGHASDLFKYAAIVSCLFICAFSLSRPPSPERRNVARIQTIVFCFTLAADFCLLFTDYFSAGVLFFLGAHSCAILRYKPRWLIPAGISAAALFAAIMLALPAKLHTDPGLTLVIAACSAYAILIITVAASTFHSPQPRENELFSRIGMILFLACDINVAIFNGLPAGGVLHTASTVLMWFFYLPAQTLLALSATKLPLIARNIS